MSTKEKEAAAVW